MADADGATKFEDLEKVEAGLKDLNPKPVCVLSHALKNLNKDHSLRHNLMVDYGTPSHLCLVLQILFFVFNTLMFVSG